MGEGGFAGDFLQTILQGNSFLGAANIEITFHNLPEIIKSIS
jgi:hypothetical protein